MNAICTAVGYAVVLGLTAIGATSVAKRVGGWWAMAQNNRPPEPR